MKSLKSFPGYVEGIVKNGIFCIRIEPVTDVGIEKLLLDTLSCNTEIKVEEYIKCRDKIKEDMVNPEWLGDMTKDDILYLLNNDSRIWMYYHKNNFVCSMMLIPATEEDVYKFGLSCNYLEVVDYGC